MIDVNDFQPVLRMGITVDEEAYIARKLAPVVDKVEDRVLDIAPSNCLIPIYLSVELGKEILAVDDWKYFKREDAEKLIKKYNANVKLFDGLPKIPFGNESFYFIYSVMYFYNLKRDIMKIVVSEIRRILKTHGQVLIVDPIMTRGKIRKEMEEQKFKLIEYTENNALSFSKWEKTE
ncbi:methyltransferase domain-containing protein [Stygiolobus caldivivus]|uniref:Methyltransferase type 11 domain-containing protein n=1 Tax=Stygiolobus caldivivus TaxID=2824673 RepID=A0A8D5ZJT9_9CREN|nr:methyltransferase domain-containing protein [Stygiolobus caldivivus]BCU70996.1 hypothetical protein KN1_22930 [Stygiolobus caldivivus]